MCIKLQDLRQALDPENHVTSQTYDNVGNVATKVDGKNNTTTYTYDEFRRLKTISNALNEITSYTYDLNNNMLTQTDGRSKVTTFTYNVANKPVTRVDHGGGTSKTELYTYMADGNLITKTDRNQVVSTYVYDIQGRMSMQTVGTKTISYTYDANANQLTIVDGTGTTTRTYDELNRVTSKTVPNIGTTTFIYDITTGVPAGGTTEKASDPKNHVTTKVYDRVGRLYQVKNGDEDVATYTYYDNGARESVTYAGGVKGEYTYTDDGLLQKLVNKKSDGSVIDTYTYTYDEAHNQLIKSEVVNGVNKGITAFAYDKLNRLSSVTEPTGKVTTYTFDASGNRLTETIIVGTNTTDNTYGYNDQNRLLQVTTKLNGVTTEVRSYTYDSNGNQLVTTRTPYVGGVPQTPVTVATNSYDVWNQLVGTTSGATIVLNSYNGEGYRVGKTVNGVSTRYLYEGDKVVLEIDGNNVETARNIYGLNLLSRTVDGQELNYLYNGHADVVALVQNDGTIAATYYYDAFGNVLQSTETVNNPIRYAGYTYDSETGLYYLNARMYDPVTARFMQEDDPAYIDPNDPLSLNLYTYCHNEPVMYWDQTGHKEGDWWDLVSNTKLVYRVLTDEKERKETFDMIDKHGSTYDKIMSRVTLGTAVGASEGIVAVTAAYAAPAIAASSVGTTLSTAGAATATFATMNAQRAMPIVNSIASKAITSGSNIYNNLGNALLRGASTPIGNALVTNGHKYLAQADVAYNSGQTVKDMVQGNWNNVPNDILYTANSFITERYISVSSNNGSRYAKTSNGYTGSSSSWGAKAGVSGDIGLAGRGYKPLSGERTLEGFVKNNVSTEAEVGLYTKSSGFNNNSVTGVGEQFKRFGANPQHGINGPHVHQPTRGVNSKTGEIFGSQGSKTSNGGVTSPTTKDVKQLYDNIYNGKYQK